MMTPNRTETIPLIVPEVPEGVYQSQPSPYLAYRHLRLIPLEEPDRCYPGIRSTQPACSIDTAKVGAVTCLAISMLTTIAAFGSICFCFPAAKWVAVGAAGTGFSSGGLWETAKYIESRSVDPLRAQLIELTESLCQDAEGEDENVKIIDVHVQRIFPLLNKELYIHLDMDQTRACYIRPDLRPALLANRSHLKSDIAEYWEKVNEHHRLSPDAFLKKWGNDYYRNHVLEQEIKQAVIELLPDELGQNQEVRSFLDGITEPSERETASSQPPPASSSSGYTEKHKKYMQFILNGVTFTFERYILEDTAFYKDQLSVMSRLGEGEKTSLLDENITFLPLKIHEDDQELLCDLFRVYRDSSLRFDYEFICKLYYIAERYGLETVLLVTLQRICTQANMYNLLELSYDLRWPDLQKDICVFITQAIAGVPIEIFPSLISELNLFHISAFAVDKKIVSLQEVLEVRYILCYKYLIEGFKAAQHGEDIRPRISEFSQNATILEPSRRFLKDTEVVTLHLLLKAEVKGYLVNVANLKRVSRIFSNSSDPSMLKRCVIEILKEPDMKRMLAKAFPERMPNNLYRELYGDRNHPKT